MEDFDSEINSIAKRMTGAITSLKSDFLSLRTGRASSNMLDPISVDVYGAKMPLNQCATITVPEPRMIQLNVWDSSNIVLVEKSIMNSGLGLNPHTEGNLIRLILPELNEERRKELAKLAANYSENAKIAVASEVGKVQILDLSPLPKRNVNDTKRNILMGILFGLASGFGLAFGIEFFI